MAFLRYGGFWISTAIETPLTANTPVKASGTTTALPLFGFTHTNGRLTCNETTSRVYMVNAAIGLTKAAGGATVGTLHLYKNGAAIDGGNISRALANTADEGAMSVMTLVALTNTDYMELWIEDIDGDNITLEEGSLIITVAG